MSFRPQSDNALNITGANLIFACVSIPNLDYYRKALSHPPFHAGSIFTCTESKLNALVLSVGSVFSRTDSWSRKKLPVNNLCCLSKRHIVKILNIYNSTIYYNEFIIPIKTCFTNNKP